MADLASVLVAVAVRPGGRMVELGLRHLAAGKPILAVLPPPGETGCEGNHRLMQAGARGVVIPHPPAPASPPIQSNDDPTAIAAAQHWPIELPPDRFLWHYTRPWPGPWPNQCWCDYVGSLRERRPGCRHSAADAVANILAGNRINGGDRIIRGRIPVVCLTSQGPDRIGPLRRYRRGLGRWDFPSVCLGIERVAAEFLGARPVVYGSDADYATLPIDQRFLFQRAESRRAGGDWRSEREWRIEGSIDLASIGRHELVVVVDNAADWSQLEQLGRCPVYLWTRG